MKFGIVQGRLTRSSKLQAFPKDWAREFVLAEEIGYDYIELIAEQDHNPDNPLWTTKKAFPRFCPVICNDYIIKHGIDVDQCFRLINQCHWFDTIMIVLPLFEAAENPNKDKIDEILGYANDNEIGICFETTWDSDFWPVVYDTGNRAAVGYDLPGNIKLLDQHIVHVHIKDKDAKGRNVMLGTGLVNFKDTLKALVDTGYDGTMTFETTRGKDPIETAKHNLAFIKDILKEVS